MLTKICKFLTNHWTHTISAVVLAGMLLYAHGCEATVPSLMHPEKKVSRGELQVELKTIIATSELRFMDLDKQDALRDLILQNAFVLAQGAPFNPLGLISGIAALYGLGSAANDTKKLIKKKISPGY